MLRTTLPEDIIQSNFKILSTDFLYVKFSTVGKDIVDLYLDRIRKLSDDCTGLQGYLVFNAVDGDTGSGLGSLLLERALDIERPTYRNTNRLISQIISSLTTSLRFNGAINVDITEFQTNLVPYPRIQFMLSSYAPMLSLSHQVPPTGFKCGINYQLPTVVPDGDLARLQHAVCMISNNTNTTAVVEVPPTGFKCGINYQLPTVVPDGDLARVQHAVCMISNNTTAVVEVPPTGFKCGINYQLPTVVPDGDLARVQHAVCMISNNTTAVVEVFS
ncbi:hypothetical protein HAX54_026516 [Datura stramonium]|uniref:Tubulin/FtsZ 2-layer sandwich domain-containing protein n=1 Tax=Datura stramonium TaxID=4076 RepID=A0ABS8S7W5_DATST|nr:hypothetical protein [Datura stramonium]